MATDINDIDLSKVQWKRIGLNALAIMLIVFASSWGDPSTFMLAAKAGLIAGVLAFARELQDCTAPPANGSSSSATKISSFLFL